MDMRASTEMSAPMDKGAHKEKGAPVDTGVSVDIIAPMGHECI